VTEQAKTPSGANAPYKIKQRAGKWVVLNYTGKAKDRIAAGVPTPHPAVVPLGDDACVVCGLSKDNPIHDPKNMPVGPVGQKPDADKMAPVMAAEENSTGVMVAFFPPDDMASDLALDDESAEDPSELHVTLAYLGRVDALSGEDQQRLRKLVEGFAHSAAPVDGLISGYGVFAPPSSPGAEDVTPVTYLSVDCPDLPAFRQRLVETLQAAGFAVAMNHGFTPHMTLAYGDMSGQCEPNSQEIEFDEISLVIGNERIDYPLTAPDSEDAEMAAEAVTMSDGKYPISDQKSANSAWKLRNHSDHSESEVVAHIRRACTKLGLKFPGDDSEKSADEEPTDEERAAMLLVEGADDEADAGKLAQGLDAAIDQALTLLRSVSSDDLPPYAAQARDLLQGVEETCDALLEYFGVSDSDEEPDRQDVAAGEQGSTLAAHTKMLAENAKRFARARELEGRIDPVPLETIKAFLTEVGGKTLLTAPASTRDLGMWEKALTPNEHMLWIQGRFVGADEPNRNGAFWSSADLERGASTVPFGPLNWLHDGQKIIGCIADQRMVYPDEQSAEQGLRPHIAAVSAMYRWIYPEEAAVIEMAADRGQLWYSMECISKEVACVGDSGCGRQVSYMDYLRGNGCDHMTKRTGVRQLIDPTFLGGAVIVPPARPGWADADATLMRQAASYAEQAVEQMGTSDLPGFEVERLLAEVLRFATV
jgi:2'-5' RNA ligase